MSFNLPNPCLLGILLVISTHNGPQLVFKYPENLSDKPNGGNELDEDEYKVYESDDDSESSEDDWDTKHYNYYSGTKKDLLLFLDDQERRRQEKPNERTSGLGIRTASGNSKGHKSRMSEDSISFDTSNYLKKTISSVSDSMSNQSKHTVPEISSIFGIEQDYLVETLCPPKEMCNARFEINIDNYIFEGLPIHCYDNGTWRKKAKSTSITEGSSLDISVDSTNITSMNMFHLVFVMKPPVIESNYRLDEMYHYVISRLALVLRHEQLKYDYIWSQAKLVSKLKEEFKTQPLYNDLTNFLIDKSSLCKMIADCFISISNSEIANLSIHNKLRSFQIPIKTEFYSIPESTVPYMPGAHLSTTVSLIAKTGLINLGETTRYGMTNSLSMLLGGTIADGMNEPNVNSDNDEDTNTNADDIIHLALLLLDDPEAIIKDIKAEPNLVLANFIRMIRPTESLMKLNTKLRSENTTITFDISQIKSFAFHLIYWRRARVIAPLNTRAVYIVSPMAPITINMYSDITKFKDAFPTMPSLPQFLKLLSPSTRKPKQFASIIPSKDHRDIYLEALGWLIRYGYVTKLNTFIWLKISKKLRIKVEEDIENENLESNSKKKTSRRTVQGTDNTSKDVDNRQSSQSSQISNSYEKDIDFITLGLKSNQMGLDITLEEEEDSIILDPGRASTFERRCIHKIVTDECKLSPELVSLFYNILKYFNGKTALEFLLLRENISKNDFRRLLLQIEDHIISVRHW